MIDKLFSLGGRGGKTFPQMLLADEKLKFPHRQFKSIHIAGTNGKGSVATKIAAALRASSYKVGLYTSPHIHNFRERIQINGELISQNVAEEIFNEVFDPSLSFFDVLTLMAFIHFAREKVDYAVIEAGIGGRLDATNVICPVLSIITSIGLDHTAILGDTLELIAKEKGGIVKPNVPLIVGPSAGPFFPNARVACSAPNYYLENRNIAKLALLELGIEGEAGLDAQPSCRFAKKGQLIFDVAHNEAAFEKLVQMLQFHYPNQKFPFFLAFSKEKDWKRCLKVIEPVAEEITFLKSAHPRLIQFLNAKEVCPIRGVVAGSFYIMDEIQIKDGAFGRSHHL